MEVSKMKKMNKVNKVKFCPQNKKSHEKVKKEKFPKQGQNLTFLPSSQITLLDNLNGILLF